MPTTRAYWTVGPGRGEIRTEPEPAPGPGDVRIRTLFSGISRGTERLVHRGGVPAVEYERMRGPFQRGDLPGPIAYGYLNVGVVDTGPDDLLGRTVFSLAPHQTSSVLPAAAAFAVPDGVPDRRAVLAGVVETALNALWDVPPLLGDAVTVVGGGLVGSCVARLAARIPGTTVTIVDVNPERAATAAALGVAFALPEGAPTDQDVVFHTSATGAGLAGALELLRPDRTVVDLSWYGDRPVALPLGGPFHANRLTIRSSQVGLVAPARRDGRTTGERLRLALGLLADPAFDALLTGTSPFERLPEVMTAIADGSLPGLCHVLEYGGG
jgi:threonine dehydrogenase-like Zn-dependent dehydrogenase